MPNLNPFAPKTSSYHRLSNNSTEGESDACASSSSTPQKEEYGTNAGLLLAQKIRRPKRSCFMHTCGYIVVALLSLSVGLGLSHLINLEHEVDGYIAPYGSPHRNINHVVWSQNASFAGEPTAETEKNWESIIPLGRGFIKHPKLAKEIKSVAAFHEIHCLHGLRQAFYKNAYLLAKLHHHSRSLPHTGPPHPDTSDQPTHDHASLPEFKPNPYIESLLSAQDMHGHDHITHCFEYLRQALMCAADTNLEHTESLVDENGEGVVDTDGWRAERVCRDYEAVKGWAERWRVGDAGGIV